MQQTKPGSSKKGNKFVALHFLETFTEDAANFVFAALKDLQTHRRNIGVAKHEWEVSSFIKLTVCSLFW